MTVIFKDGTDIFWARQLVAERLAAAKESLPPGLGEPQLRPDRDRARRDLHVDARGLAGRPAARRQTPYELTDLRTIQDWIVRPQLRTVPGVTEVNSIGGYERLYQVSPDPAKLVGYGLSFRDVLEAVARQQRQRGRWLHRAQGRAVPDPRDGARCRARTTSVASSSAITTGS